MKPNINIKNNWVYEFMWESFFLILFLFFISVEIKRSLYILADLAGRSCRMSLCGESARSPEMIPFASRLGGKDSHEACARAVHRIRLMITSWPCCGRDFGTDSTALVMW